MKIGNITIENNTALAPMAGVTDLAFRQLCREMGCGLLYTEMVSAKAILYKNKNTFPLLETAPAEHPIAVQIFGSDADIMADMAAKLAEERSFDIIDINMGCPVPNVFKAGEGCAMMLDMPRAAAVIRAVKKSGKVVTVKCRTGIKENDMFAAEFARMCEDAGADMITIHGRSRSMMYDGVPHYEEIAQAKAAVSIPVIANGGINSVSDAERVMEITGADGVMLARYALENPFVIRDLTGVPYEKSFLEVMLEQLSLALLYYDETFALRYVRCIAANGMKKRRGTKKYKEGLYRAGSVGELKEILELIFGEEPASAT